MAEVRIIEYKRMDLKGAYVIDGFPSVGLVGAIAANYLTSLLDLELIGTMESDGFPNLSVVRNGVPLNPVRIYAGPMGNDGDRLVVFVSEFQPTAEMIRPMSSAIMAWMQKKKCRMMFSPEGLANPNEDMDEAIKEVISTRDDITVYGAGSTIGSLSVLESSEVEFYDNGIIVGLAGMLLNEGVKRNIDVITLLADTNAFIPDARAAAALLEAIDRILLHVEFDIEPLLKEAEAIEKGLKEIHQSAIQGDDSVSKVRPIMYG